MAARWSVWVPDLLKSLDFACRNVHAVAVCFPAILLHALVFSGDVCLSDARIVSVELQA